MARSARLTPQVSVRERLAFWAKLPERLARLGNRVGPDEHAKVYAALHARIPMVTPDEQRAIQEANAEDDERFWDAMRDIGASSVEGHKALIARAEAVIAKEAPRVAEAGEKVEAAKSRLERLKRGEDVAGGLGKPFDVERALKAEGFTERDLRRMRLLASLTEAEMKQASATDVRGSGRRGGQGRRARGPSDHTGEARSRAAALERGRARDAAIDGARAWSAFDRAGRASGLGAPLSHVP